MTQIYTYQSQLVRELRTVPNQQKKPSARAVFLYGLRVGCRTERPLVRFDRSVAQVMASLIYFCRPALLSTSEPAPKNALLRGEPLGRINPTPATHNNTPIKTFSIPQKP